MSGTSSLPLLTAGLPGCGGAPLELGDFVVHEIPAYLPTGSGEHCFALIEKSDISTQGALRSICAALGVSPSQAGYAGLKDRLGFTRQWISVQGVRPEAMQGLQLDGIRVLEAALHKNKLKTGHLRGNQFHIVLRDVAPDALARAQAILEQLTRRGLPNYYGGQRFGRRGDNAEQGARLLRGELKVRDRFRRRMLVSALQSELFNRVLARRLEQDCVDRLLGGEVLQRTDSGGLFVSEPAQHAEAAERLARREVVITGPICGPRMPQPAPQSLAWTLEHEVFDASKLAPDDFAALGRIARGGRRPLMVAVEGAQVEPHAAGLQLSFSLPSGCYATVLLREVTKRGEGPE